MTFVCAGCVQRVRAQPRIGRAGLRDVRGCAAAVAVLVPAPAVALLAAGYGSAGVVKLM